MNDIIQVGTFNLYVPYLFYIIAIILSSLFGGMMARRLPSQISKKTSDLVIEYWVCFLIVWKLCYFILYPSDLWENPLSVIYFDGGKIGVILGFLTVVIYIYFQYYRRQISISFQLLLIFQALVVWILFDRLTVFIYYFDYYVLIESILYIIFMGLVWHFSKMMNKLLLAKLIRWFLILWVSLELLTGDLDLYTNWLLIALLAAICCLIYEWVLSGKEKDHEYID
ncbi:hypothetical protein [Alkalibacillus aidingensis]|uniref:hypothetical protein n=1 Tax=Alkalibacillus aidingensis TaxID=2747607 RepID=UPI0016616DB6|nr:hypothetical protein [Alkalibacillus aidingensis]